MKLESDTAISQVGFCVSAYVHVCMWFNKKKKNSCLLVQCTLFRSS